MPKAEGSKQEKGSGEKAQFHVSCPLPQRAAGETGGWSTALGYVPSFVNSSGLFLPGTNCSLLRLALTTFLQQV